MELKIYCDGASRGNPGKSAYAFIIIGGGIHCGTLGENTNNVAEYLAINNTINYMCSDDFLKDSDITIFSDSELVIKQLNGKYRTKDEKLKLMQRIISEKVKKFRFVRFEWVSSDHPKIQLADSLCNMILDKARTV